MAARYLDFQCRECGLLLEDIFTRENNIQCPNCNGVMDIIWLKPPGVGDPIRLGVAKPSSDFDKYVLGRIKEKYPGSTIGETRQLAREI